MTDELMEILAEIARIKALLLSLNLHEVGEKLMLDLLNDATAPLLNKVDFGLNSFLTGPRDV